MCWSPRACLLRHRNTVGHVALHCGCQVVSSTFFIATNSATSFGAPRQLLFFCLNASFNAAHLGSYGLAFIWRSLLVDWLACASLCRYVAKGNTRVGWRNGPLIVSWQLRQMRWPHCDHHYQNRHHQPRQ